MCLFQVTQTFNITKDKRLNDFRIFEAMTELVTDAHGPRRNHADMGQVRDFLEKNGLGDVFSEIFAV